MYQLSRWFHSKANLPLAAAAAPGLSLIDSNPCKFMMVDIITTRCKLPSQTRTRPEGRPGPLGPTVDPETDPELVTVGLNSVQHDRSTENNIYFKLHSKIDKYQHSQQCIIYSRFN